MAETQVTPTEPQTHTAMESAELEHNRHGGRKPRRSAFRALAFVMTAATAALGVLAVGVGGAGATMVSWSGRGLNMSYPSWDNCQMNVTYDFTGAPTGMSKFVTVYGPTITNNYATARTVWYRALLVDARSGAVTNHSYWASYKLAARGAVKFGSIYFSVPWANVSNTRNHVAELEIYAYSGNVQTAYALWKTDDYRIYGESGLGVVEGGHFSSC